MGVAADRARSAHHGDSLPWRYGAKQAATKQAAEAGDQTTLMQMPQDALDD